MAALYHWLRRKEAEKMTNKICPTVSLYDGTQIPTVGYGVAGLKANEDLEQAIACALAEGYRFFDNAPFYGNEAPVGAALRNSGVDRKELFISTKLPNYCHAYDDAIAAFHKSRTLMGLDYLDMYLIHHPMPKRGLFTEAWRALETLKEEGYVRVIGISNFLEHHMDEVLKTCKVKPMVNELECNPYYTIEPLRKYCDEHEIRVVTWFPLGGPLVPPPPIPPRPPGFLNMREDEVLKTIAAKYGKSTSQIALKWAVELGMIPIPKSANPERIRSNIDIFDFSLTIEELARISAMNIDRRLGPDPNLHDEDEATPMGA
jgi:diketogulonate reductase-like aldo/keto reductase